MYFETEYEMAIQSSKVNFQLVINSNLGPILPRFRDIAGFLLRRAPPPLFHPNFGVFPLDRIAGCCGSEEWDPKLIIHVITFELTQHIWPRYINITNTQTDRQMDGQLTVAIPHEAYALRSKN